MNLTTKTWQLSILMSPKTRKLKFVTWKDLEIEPTRPVATVITPGCPQSLGKMEVLAVEFKSCQVPHFPQTKIAIFFYCIQLHSEIIWCEI